MCFYDFYGFHKIVIVRAPRWFSKKSEILFRKIMKKKFQKKKKIEKFEKIFFRQNVGKSPKNNLFFSEYRICKKRFFFFSTLKKCDFFQKKKFRFLISTLNIDLDIFFQNLGNDK